MKNQYKLASLFCMAGLGMLTMTGCEGGDLYDIDAPDWIASRADSIADAKKQNQGGDEELEGMMEDVYTFGKTDYTSGFWSAFSKYYVVPDGQKWYAQFNLNINPDDNTYYKNFALIVANNTRDGAGYSEYGAFRYDLTTDAKTWNSNWGTVFGVIEGTDFKYTDSNLKFTPESNKDAGLQKMNGKVTLTIDRTDANRYFMKIDNGTITKTFDMPSNIAPGEDIYCFLVPEGSYIDFLATNIEPIGGCTSALDKQPISLVLNGVPAEVELGTPLEDVLARITARVEFEEGVAKDVTLDDLQLQVVPDNMDELGKKTIVAVYNKTFKGENCDTPVIATAQFEVVYDTTPYTTVMAFPTPIILGEEDNSTKWWTYHTEQIKVENRQTAIVTFTNYTNGATNWNNFLVVLNRQDLSEYCVVRADNYGWGAGYDNNPTLVHGCDWSDEAAWRMAMDGAHVTAYISNNGDGTANIKAEIVGSDGNIYNLWYQGISGIDKNDMWFRFTCEGSHLVFDTPEDYTTYVTPNPTVVGAEDNSSAWWTAFTDNIKIDPFRTVVTSFTNYSCGANNWNNFNIILNGEALNEYCVVRADNYGWCGALNTGGNLAELGWEIGGTQGDWGTWLAAMNGAHCIVSITNLGNGKANVDCVMEGTDGITYTQYYHNITVDADDLYFRYVVDGSHLVFDSVQ